MSSVLLGIATVLIGWGSFLVASAALDRTANQATKLGRIIRGGMTEFIGLLFWLGGYFAGGSNQILAPALILGLAIGGTLGIFHVLLRNRNAAPPPN